MKEFSPAEAAAAVKEIKPVTYPYKDDTGQPHVGFVAADVPDPVATKDRKAEVVDIVAELTKVAQEQIVEKQHKVTRHMKHWNHDKARKLYRNRYLFNIACDLFFTFSKHR
jgi:hypothetical protein